MYFHLSLFSLSVLLIEINYFLKNENLVAVTSAGELLLLRSIEYVKNNIVIDNNL